MRSHARNPLRSDLARAVLDRADCGATRGDVRTLLDAIRAWMRQSLHTTLDFRLPGMFWARVVRMPARPARVGRNPRTGEALTIAASPARHVVRLRVDAGWKREVFAGLPLKRDADGARPVIDHANLKVGPIVAPSPARGLRAFVKAIAPLFARLSKPQITALYLALRDVVAERVIVTGRCAIPGLAIVRFQVRKAVPERRLLNPFTREWMTFAARPAKSGCTAAVVKAERVVVIKTAGRSSVGAP